MRFRSQVGGKAFKGIDPLGGTLNLPLRLLAEGTDPMHAVTRGYADAAAMSFDASTLTGVLPAGRLPAYTGSEISSAGGGLFALQPTGVTAGSYAKVQVNAKGRVVAGDTLVAADIPTLTFSKVVNRPTTLAGYGITDVVSLAGGEMTGPLSLTQAPTAANQLANKEYVDGKVGGSGSSPFVTGDIVYRSSSSVPAGYLRCNGAQISKATYAGLYAVLGDQFTKNMHNSGSSFNLPDLTASDTATSYSYIKY
jgi:phage-related tail fiber protein